MLISHSSQTVAALRQRLDELLEERDGLLDEKARNEVAKEEVERELQTARTDCTYVPKNAANGQ
jgi:protein HOOK3